nr:MAG TPA: hypothetical protein [Caudoviricetes sp.]
MFWRLAKRKPNRLQSKGLYKINYVVIIPLFERKKK